MGWNSFSPKVYSTNRPNRLKTLLKVFWQFKTLLKVFCFGKTLLKFICWACSRKTLLCFAIHLNNCFTSVPYVPYCYAQIIVSTKDDLCPHRPPPLPLSAPCWCRRHHCPPPPPGPIRLLFLPLFGWLLIVVCPFTASASATVACARTCRCWLLMPLRLSLRPLTAAPCSFHRNRVMFKILHLK